MPPISSIDRPLASRNQPFATLPERATMTSSRPPPEYVPRPDRAVESRKKSQRNASEVRDRLKAEKKRRVFEEKRRKETLRRERREEILEKLAKNALPREFDRTLLNRAVDLRAGEDKDRAKRTRGDEQHSSMRDDDDETVDDHTQKKPKSLTTTSSSTHPTFITRDVSSDDDADSSASDDDDRAVVEEVTAAATTTTPTVLTNTVHIPHMRAKAVEASRRSLPVCMMEQEIMESIMDHPFTIVTGETGSGKTTQVPQFLLEAGFGCTVEGNPHPGLVVVCQPRRVATISTAERVAFELGVDLRESALEEGSSSTMRKKSATIVNDDPRADVSSRALSAPGTVAYQVRYESSASLGRATRLKFVTDGVLLREAKEDVLLRAYSCVVLDEAHERGINSDLLLGILSRVVPLRQRLYEEQLAKMQNPITVRPLKVVVMSATLDGEAFLANERLGMRRTGCGLVKVDARQHPVTIHFSRRTVLDNYLDATFRKVCAVHRKLPAGGILVFLTGRAEIHWMEKKLKETLETTVSSSSSSTTAAKRSSSSEKRQNDDDDAEIGDSGTDDDDDDNEEKADQQWTEQEDDDDDDASSVSSTSSTEDEIHIAHFGKGQPREIRVLPLYSRLSARRQRQAFLPNATSAPRTTNTKSEAHAKDSAPPPPPRLIVLATNIAETSLTIPGIRYVVDCGREKTRSFDATTEASSFRVEWISQASANQRAGRAGRVGPGHCYRLYSAAVFNDRLLPQSAPEILRLPVDDLVLYMKTMGVKEVSDFPFPTPVDKTALAAAITRLIALGALVNGGDSTAVTPLGERMAHFPVSSRLAKAIVVAARLKDEAARRRLLPQVVAAVAMSSVPNPFTFMEGGGGGGEEEQEDARKKRRELFTMWRGDGTADALSLVRALGAYIHEEAKNGGTHALSAFCMRHGLDEKAMAEARRLQLQLWRTVCRRLLAQTVSSSFTPVTTPGDSAAFRQVWACGFSDRIARKLTLAEVRARDPTFSLARLARPADWPYESCDASLRGESAVVRLPPRGSFVPPPLDDSAATPDVLPGWIAYSSVRADDGRLGGICVVEPTWLRWLPCEPGEEPGMSTTTTTSVKWGPMLSAPEPGYDPEADATYCYRRLTYGPREWVLPAERTSTFETPFARAAHFARALMEGHVLGPSLTPASLLTHLDVAPATVIKASFAPRVLELVEALVRSGVASKEGLVSRWRRAPDFLKRELRAWIVPERRGEVFEREWKTMIETVLRGGVKS